MQEKNKHFFPAFTWNFLKVFSRVYPYGVIRQKVIVRKILKIIVIFEWVVINVAEIIGDRQWKSTWFVTIPKKTPLVYSQALLLEILCENYPCWGGIMKLTDWKIIFINYLKVGEKQILLSPTAWLELVKS